MCLIDITKVLDRIRLKDVTNISGNLNKFNSGNTTRIKNNQELTN